MPRVGFEPTIPASKRVETVHALDHWGGICGGQSGTGAGFLRVLGEIGRDGMDWIDLSQDRDQWMALVNTVMNLRVP
jgi:hypothetical protein